MKTEIKGPKCNKRKFFVIARAYRLKVALLGDLTVVLLRAKSIDRECAVDYMARTWANFGPELPNVLF